MPANEWVSIGAVNAAYVRSEDMMNLCMKSAGGLVIKKKKKADSGGVNKSWRWGCECECECECE